MAKEWAEGHATREKEECLANIAFLKREEEREFKEALAYLGDEY
jgi:hypothetical protein